MQIIRGIQPRPRRIMLYGVHGCGKSTWASNAPEPLVLNLEDGVGDIDVAKTPVLRSYPEVLQALAWVYREAHTFKTLIVDTADWLNKLLVNDVCSKAGKESLAEVGGGFGKGNALLDSRWSAILEQLMLIYEQRRMAIIILAHAKVEKVRPPEQDAYDKYAPDLPAESASTLMEWADEVLFANFKTYVAEKKDGITQTRGMASGGKDVFLRTSETAYAYAKNRISGMPSELPMDWAAYYSHVKTHYERVKRGDIEGLVVEGSSKTEAAKQLERDAAEVFG
jgi:hypothetical protein